MFSNPVPTAVHASATPFDSPAKPALTTGAASDPFGGVAPMNGSATAGGSSRLAALPTNVSFPGGGGGGQKVSG